MPGTVGVAKVSGNFAWFVMGDKKVGIAQIEMMGAKKLIEERGGEITQTLEKIKQTMNLNFVFQNTIELADCKNFFVTHDSGTKELLEKIFNIKFTDISAERPNLIMRKQIVALLKEELEK